MTDDEARIMHKLLAEYHRSLARSAVLNIMQAYHADLAERFTLEVRRIPQRAETRARIARFDDAVKNQWSLGQRAKDKDW